VTLASAVDSVPQVIPEASFACPADNNFRPAKPTQKFKVPVNVLRFVARVRKNGVVNWQQIAVDKHQEKRR
jgi:hypothetical protein